VRHLGGGKLPGREKTGTYIEYIMKLEIIIVRLLIFSEKGPPAPGMAGEDIRISDRKRSDILIES